MSTAVAPETQNLGVKDAPAAPVAPPLSVTEKAASEVRRHIADMQASGQIEPGGTLYLRVRVQGGGCSGFQNKLDLDPVINDKLDEVIEQHGVPIVVDKRSLMYLSDVVVDFHDDLNRRGFSINNPSAKSTCGCGSSFSM
jgi:iron-sulfur cluster assembly accessory protein